MNLLYATLDLIFPRSFRIKTIERLNPSEFANQVSQAIDISPGIISLWDYDDPLVRDSLWSLKYKGNTKVASLFSHCLYDVILEKLSEEQLFYNFTNPILIPLPISKERLKERGWNQTELLAHELEKLDRNSNFIVSTKILKKIKHTLPQTTLNRAGRLKNLKGAFQVTGVNHVKDKNIILIDDVTTTGSTIQEAKQTLLRAGAHRIIAFTIAS